MTNMRSGLLFQNINWQNKGLVFDNLDKNLSQPSQLSTLATYPHTNKSTMSPKCLIVSSQDNQVSVDEKCE